MEEEQQRQLQAAPFQSPLNNIGAAILTLTNPENDLYKLELTLRGMKLDLDGNTIKVGEQLVNDAGISDIVGLTQSVVSQMTVMNHFKDRDINCMMLDFADTLVRDLMWKRKEWGIKNGNDRNRIVFVCRMSAWNIMMRANEGGDRRFWKGTQQDIRTTVVNESGGKSLFSKLNPWNMKN